MSKDKGLYQKYKVTKISNPKKKITAVVLEFDDPIARVGIKAWAKELGKKGYVHCASDVLRKCEKFESVEQ